MNAVLGVNGIVVCIYCEYLTFNNLLRYNNSGLMFWSVNVLLYPQIIDSYFKLLLS